MAQVYGPAERKCSACPVLAAALLNFALVPGLFFGQHRPRYWGSNGTWDSPVLQNALLSAPPAGNEGFVFEDEHKTEKVTHRILVLSD